MNLMTMGKAIGAALVMGALFTTLPACQKQEGPAEKAGREIDKAADKVGQQVEKAGGSIQDAAQGDNK